MCMKLPPGDLNLSPCPLHSTNTYTCGVTIALRECGGIGGRILKGNDLVSEFFFFFLPVHDLIKSHRFQ